MTRVYLTGSGAFGRAVATALEDHGHTLVGLAVPERGRHGKRDGLTAWADWNTSAPVTTHTLLHPEDVPDGTDVILAAHSHAFVGRRTRARAPYALGYHPSLLPLHRGRDAVRWTCRMGDRVTGGSVYHLTDRVDGGPLAAQEHIVIDPTEGPSALWREHLFPLGVRMLTDVVDLIGSGGTVPTVPQDDALATWEPSLDSAPVYRPELFELAP